MSCSVAIGIPTERRWRTTPLIRASRAIASKRSPSSRTLSRGLAANRCHNGRGGSGSVGRSSSRTNTTNWGGLPIERRTLETSHHSQRKGNSSTPAPLGAKSRAPPGRADRRPGRPPHQMGRMPLYDLRNLEMLVHVLAQPRRPVLAADMVVVGHAREEVMGARGDVATVGPLLPL